MIQPMLLDVVETIYPLVESSPTTGTRGTIVHCHVDGSYEVEFNDDDGETIAVHTFTREQFVVVWQAGNGEEVPLAEQVAQVVALLPDRVGTEVLDFARFLSWQRLKAVEAMV